MSVHWGYHFMANPDKLFTHPVLSSDNDDYSDSFFDLELKVENVFRESRLKFDIKLINDDLNQLINDGKAVILIKIDCPFTCFRFPIITTDKQSEKCISSSQLSGKVTVVAYIVAKDNIKGFTSNYFNDDYSGITFDFSKGDILAESSMLKFDVPKVNQNIDDSPSIITIQEDEKLNGRPAEVRLDDDLIAIRMGTEEFSNYNLLYKQPQMRNVIFSMIVIPALMTVFATLKHDGPENYYTKRWFNVISKSMGSEITMNEDRIDFKDYSSFELAQLSLSNPLGLAFKSILEIEKNGGDV